MQKMALPLLITIILLIGCTTEQEKVLDEWRGTAQLTAEQTPEELYELAIEEDTLIIYSTTTRIYDVKETFEEQYPGLTVEVYDTRAYDLVEILYQNYETMDWNCDIVICSDDIGLLSAELEPLGVVNKYVPYDIAPHLHESANAELLSFVGETEQLFYNPTIFEECPIENWWEMTEPQWYGKIYMNSPLRSYPAYALVHAVIANSEKMEQAYFDLYGEPLDLPEGSNAGMVFWEMLLDNGLQFTTSSNELVEIVGRSDVSGDALVFMISSKIRRSEIGLAAAVAYGVAPTDGVYSSNTISIAGGAKNVNSAKLFIRWLLGETDGTGEGSQPYLLDGTWPIRTDIPDHSTVPLDEGEFWFNDKAEVAENREGILEFWESLQAEVE